MKRIFFLISTFSFLILTSCKVGFGGALNSNVVVFVAPYGSGERIRYKGNRVVLYSKSITGEGICRRYPYTIHQARENLSKLGLEKEIIDQFLGEDVEQQDHGAVGRNDPVTTSVGDNWLKFGLLVDNQNKGEDRNFYLLVDSLTYVATANYKGEDFAHNGTIDASYCDNTPFLYFLPPGTKAHYKPFSKNFLENLTIYISGFPIIDRSDKPSYSPPQGSQNAGQQFGIQGFGQSAGNTNQQGGNQFLNQFLNQFGNQQGGVQSNNQQGGIGQGQNQIYGPDEIVVIPDYTVEVTLRGYFMTKSGEPVGDFVKRVRFFTQSSVFF